MASRVAVSDCISTLRDLWDSEEFKINSDISSSLKATVDKICREGNELFEQCFEEVKEGLEKARANNSGVFFQVMYMYLAQELPRVLEKLPSPYNDPILWQVRHV